MWCAQRPAEVGVESSEVTVGLGSIEVIGNFRSDFSRAEDFWGVVKIGLEWVRETTDRKLTQ